MKKHIATLTSLCAVFLATTAVGQSTTELLADGKSTDNVLVHGMGYSAQRHSQLSQINTRNVKRLVPVWTQSLGNNLGQEAMPVLYEGVLYIPTHDATIAIDALTGRQLWKTGLDFGPDVPKFLCCGLVNRGVAIYGGKIFRGTLDAHIQALDAKTGKQLWKTKLADYKAGYSITGAPLVVNGLLISGMSGAEYGTRGFLVGVDPNTGTEVWRRHTTAAPGEKGGDTWPGDTYLKGGGSTWVTGSYDSEQDLLFWGTGNAGPWNAAVRKGDNLYTASLLAIRPKTGEIVWHYQFNPNDAFDYDAVNEMVQADVKMNGESKKVILHANRNGFLYAIDRTTGKVIAANTFVPKVNWASGIDLQTGRPIDTEVSVKARNGESVEVWPGALGAKTWPPMSFSPKTGLVYLNAINAGMSYVTTPPEYKKGEIYLGIEFTGFIFPDGPRGYFKAIEPTTGKERWSIPRDIPSYSGVLSTAGNLVFTGTMTGEFEARAASTGKLLWSYRTGSASMGQPITWTHKGKQYVTTLSGIGGVYPLFSGDERLANVPAGGQVWTFALQP
jgi:alcohol dehydrogenase (cytochrome c)